ncbi:MAG TPA: AI-2E family transporter [Chitinophagaceae bacterium]|nr:AI-2E family transporter [Chitinophagaceae bacterium]
MMPAPGFNSRIKQVIILLLLALMMYLVIKKLYVFFPGLLGAITLYILSRGSYFQLIYNLKWRKGWTAGMYLIGYLILFTLLVYITVTLVTSRIRPFLSDPETLLAKAQQAIDVMQQKTGITVFTPETLTDMQKRVTDFIPTLINDTSMLLANLATMLFMLYYMLVHGKEMENYLQRIIPLKQSNIDMLAAETKRLVRASALGIPIISLIQGLTATIGYISFGINEYVIWGFLTGVFAFFPVVGTLIVWVPLVLYMYASGDTWNATGLLFYSLLITGNVDYLSRITLLKKWGNVHPVVTVLGVIVGLGLFGFIGLIFGPLLVNYIILLFRIYTNEFIDNKLGTN